MEFSVNNISCRRGGLRILSDVSFTVGASSTMILRGPNGSGKTTLLRTLAGLMPAEAGEINVPAASITYAGHADGLKGQLTVSENLQFWADVFGQKDITQALDTFDLTNLADRQAHHLSAGQKRRLGLSRLIVTGRPIWLLDEPTVSLDQANVNVFARVIDRHLEQGGIAVLATHIDLGLKKANTLDMTAFKAASDDTDDPFLESAFL